MPFLGTTPTQGFVGANPKQSFTANGSTTVFTLTNPVASANDLEVFVGNVRQEPTAAYTAAGTTLTMSEAPDTGLNFYVINKSQAQVTTNTPDGSVSTAKIIDNAVTVGKLATSGTLPAFNGSALTSVIPEGPAFHAEMASDFNLANNTTTTLPFATEIYDTDGCYNNTGSTVTLNGISTPAYCFAPNVAGYYSIHFQARPTVFTSKQVAYVFSIRKNASTTISTGQFDASMGSSTDAMYFNHTILVAMNGTSDYVDFRGYQYNYTSPQTISVRSASGHTYAYGHLALKL
tara:strand:+ start:250 stop:1119 length:870 start_codon:yes stop_codon:yes gene_type:complete